MLPKTLIAAIALAALASQAGAQTVISGPAIITNDIQGDLVITGGTVTSPVFLFNSLIDGNVTVTNGGFAVHSASALTVTGSFEVTNDGQFVETRPSMGFNVSGDFLVTNGGVVNFLPTGGVPSESAVILGNLRISSGGGGFFNRMAITGDVLMDDAFSCFLADSSQVGGNILATGSSIFSMETTGVAGDVILEENDFQFDNFPVSIIGSTTIGFANIGFFTSNIIEGNLKVEDNTGGFGAPVDILLGNPSAVTPACVNVGLAIESTIVRGDAEISGNDVIGSIIISNMTVDGDFEIEDNRSGGDILIGATELVLDQLCDGTNDLVLVPRTLAPNTVLSEFEIENNSAAGELFLGDNPRDDDDDDDDDDD